jgi:hypothetical protein
MTTSGIWNSQLAIVEQQKVVLRRSSRHVFCLDGSKLERQAPHFLIGWDEVEALITDLPLKKLVAAGIPLDPSRYLDLADTSEDRPIESSSQSDEMPVHIL